MPGVPARLLCGLILAGCIALAAGEAAARETPFLSDRVVDEAGLISPSVKTGLNQRLEELERATGAQLVVLTIGSLEGEDLEAYTLKVAETWELGRKDRDDGVLLLVAVADRKMRLEVGYGLEGTLTDALAGRVLDEVLRPRFREGDYEGGIEAGVVTLVKILEGQGEGALPPPPAQGSDAPWWAGILVLAVLTPFTLIGLFGSGFMGWFLWLFLLPFLYAFPQAAFGSPVGIVLSGIWFVACPIVRLNRERWGLPMWKMEGSGGSSSRSGSSWSSSSSSSSSGGSSFSGGGGSFGGGGASSSW